MSKLIFENDELLNQDQFEKVCFSPSPNEKAEIVAKALSAYMLIIDGVLYQLNRDIFIYEANKEKAQIETKIWRNISTLLESSFNAFDNNTATLVREKLSNSKARICLSTIYSKQFISKFTDIVKEELIRDATLDKYDSQLHFKNGYIDVKTKKFKKRTHKNLITKYIDRDYKPSTQKQKKEFVDRYLKPIYPKKEDLDCIISIIGSALTGKSTKEQDMIFLLGDGSAGKSTLMMISKAALTVYFIELKHDTFSTSSSEKNKILNSYIDNPQVILTWINELTSERIDTSMFKSFVEGQCTTTKLYEEGSRAFNHKSKIVATSNEFPNIQIDTGVTRRIKAYTHTSKFVEDESEVDKSKNIYLKVKDLIDDITKQGLLDVWIDILVDQSFKYLNGETIQYSENFKDTKDLVVASNDYIQDFIDSKLDITEDPSHKIGKREMHTKFHEMYPKRHLKELDIITSLKSKGIQYDKGVRSRFSIRGCFVGVVFKEDIDEGVVGPVESDAVQYHEPIDPAIVSKKVLDKIKLLEDENKRLKEELASLKEPKKVVTKKIKKVFKTPPKVTSIESESEEDEEDKTKEQSDDLVKYLKNMNF